MVNTKYGNLSNYMVLIPPDETGDLPLDGYDPDYHCPKYRVITVAMQIEEIEGEKKTHRLFLEDELVLKPQRKALSMIPTGDLIPPDGWWFDNEEDAKAFVTGVARASDVSVNIVGRGSAGSRLYQFLHKASGFLYNITESLYLQKKNGEESPPFNPQECRDKLWRALIKDSPLASDFTPELASHVILMLVCASRALANEKKALNGSTGISNKLERLQSWFEEYDKAALDQFDALHPHHRDPNHPHHFVDKEDCSGKANDTGKADNAGRGKTTAKAKNKGKARNRGKGGYRRRLGRRLPPGLSTRKPIQAQLDRYRAPPDRQPQPQPIRHPRPNPIPHRLDPERRTELPLRLMNDRRYHPY